MADFTGNSFTLLDVKELPPFAPHLPYEVLQKIHPGVMSRSRPRDGKYHEEAVLSKTSNGHISQIKGDKEISTLLAVNKSYNNFFGTYLDGFVPMHLSLKASLRQVDANETYDFQIQDLDKVMPVSARGLYLCFETKVIPLVEDNSHAQCEDTSSAEQDSPKFAGERATASAEDQEIHECSEEEKQEVDSFVKESSKQWSTTGYNIVKQLIASQAETEEYISIKTASDPSFHGLLKAVQTSHWTEDIVIEISASSDDFCVQEQDPESRPRNAIFEPLVSAVESMPHIKRYSVRVGRFGAFGSRVNMSWDVRRGHTMAFWQYDGGYLDFMDDLHVSRY